MSRRRKDPAQAAGDRLAGVPDAVALRVMAAIRRGEPPRRGSIAALGRFYGRLAEMRRSPEEVREEDFRAVVTSRTGLYTLLRVLETFAPDVPLEAARPLRAEWDAWLNARYNVKPRRERVSRQVGAPVAAWPADWQEGWAFLRQQRPIDLIDTDLKSKRPLSPKTLEATEQAVSLFVTAFGWAKARGVELPPGFSAETAEMFARYLRNDRQTRLRSVVAYLGRVRRFARRGLLMSCAGLEPFSRVIHAWEERAAAEEKKKTGVLDAFYEVHSLADIPRRAAALAREADRLPGHRARAARLRRTAALLALLVNAPERMGDVAALKLGAGELERHPAGTWSLRVVQGKTGHIKRNPALWPEVGTLLDAYILGGREPGLAQARYEALAGCFFMSLAPEPAHAKMPSVLMREEFGVGAHAIRTLVTDFLKWHAAGSAAVCQALLGHREPDMHQEYRSDFRDLAALGRYHATVAAISSNAPTMARR